MNFLSATTSRVIIALVIACAIVAAGVIIYIIFAGHIRIKKHVNEITKRYDKIHSLITVQLDNELKRIYSIAQANVEYEHIYTLNHDAYVSILNQEDTQAQAAINEINQFIIDKKYKNAKELIDIAKESVSQLENKYEKLSNSLGQIISIDEENRQEILRYRRYFREIKDSFESKKNELKYIDSSFTAVFDKIEQYFIESEKLLSAAHYNESKEKFPEIEKVLNALDRSIDILPKLVTLSYIVIPNNIDSLQQRYTELIQEGYPLHHLKVQSNIDSFNDALNKIYSRLKNFQSKNIEFELNQIRDAIITLNGDFDDEIKSRTYFKNNYEQIYNGSYGIENKFIKLRRSIPNYKVTYVLRDSCMEDMERIQSEINELGNIKRILDTYVHSSSQQPYSTLAKKLHDLAEAMNSITNDIENCHNYLSSLKRDTEDGFKYISKAYINLKNYESELRQINVQEFSNCFKTIFTQSYAYINEIGETVQRLPIDVDRVKDKLIPLKNNVDKIASQLQDQIDISIKAEESIVLANRYREGFYEVKTALLRAEKSFFEGDFIRTCDESVAIIKKNRPEIGR